MRRVFCVKIFFMNRKTDSSFLWLLFYFVLYLILLKLIMEVIGAITVAFLLALVVDVISKQLRKYLKLGNRISVVLAAVIFFGLLAYSFYSVVPISIEQGKNLYNALSKIEMPEDGVSSEIVVSVVETVKTYFGDLLLSLLNYTTTHFSGIATALLLLIIASIYMNTFKENVKQHLEKMFPLSSIERTRVFLSKVYNETKLFVSGQLLTAFLVGLITYFGMMLFRIPYAGFLAVLAGITDFIPFFGVIVTAIPALLLGFTTYGLWGIVKVLIVLLIANQLEMWFLSPKIASSRVKINWFVILVNMLIFNSLFGVVGILVSVPCLIFIKNFWFIYVSELLRKT